MTLRASGRLTLCGALLPDKEPPGGDGHHHDDDDDDSGDEQQFLDAEEMCGGLLLARCLPPRRTVIIADEYSQKEIKVYGRFPLVDPWWRMKVEVKLVGSEYWVQGYPSYFLQTHIPDNTKSIFSLFLHNCGLSNDIKAKFWEWVSEESQLPYPNFKSLVKALYEFEMDRLLEERKSQKKLDSLQNEFQGPLKTIAYSTAVLALKFPKIVEFLPILLPSIFENLLSSGYPEPMFEKMQETLDSEPWKFGFSKITYREFGLVGCEATWTALCQCKALLETIPVLQKNALITYTKLKQNCSYFGDTYVEQDRLTRELSKQMAVQDTWHALEFLRDHGIIVCEKERVALWDLHQAEKDIAFYIDHLLKIPAWHLGVDVKEVLRSGLSQKAKMADGDDPRERGPPNGALGVWGTGDGPSGSEGDVGEGAEGDVEVDEDQQSALEMICSNPVTVVSGKGGCGKTTIVSRLFSHIRQMVELEVKKACEDFESDRDVPEEWKVFGDHHQGEELSVDKYVEVLLTAPTGKAAGLLRRKTSLHAYTLHQVNYSFYAWKRSDSPLSWKFSSVRVLVVDEGSLVSVTTFRSVLKLLCQHARLVKLIILGDVRQLPSIEPGNLLMDMFEAFKTRGCSIELKTNHRAESQVIVDNATRISERKLPNFDAEVKIFQGLTKPFPSEDRRFVLILLPADGGDLYSAVNTLLKEGAALKSAKESQFIAFRRQDCDLINECCCKHYSNHLTRDHKNKMLFQCDDKICCTRNANLSDVIEKGPRNCKEASPSHGDESVLFRNENSAAPGHGDGKTDRLFETDTRLCNGEIFFITNDVVDKTSEKRFLTLDNMAGLVVTVDFRKLQRHCRIKHAWARTIHTFQGSEEQTVVYVVGRAGRQHWQHVYTAVTRGRARVYVIADEAQLCQAVHRKSYPRKTRLKQFLQEAFAGRREGQQVPGSPSTLHPARRGIAESQGLTMDPGGGAGDTGQDPVASEAEEEESTLQSKGTKRSVALGSFESPKKGIVVVEAPSPLVSSRFDNLSLKNLQPRQLFKTTNNEGQ
ncbi:DNA helicase B isoform X2 [Ornithorhynchus anatinus]|uniref:DNA helicase B isoform X2 n=1 Tax=Ornithorhynchus anatinus TaxID=9258 RepID=UPI0010A94A53|nr:DNA helicase B isoform X2 [Ornithorhynchus anatinus]